MKKRSRVKQTIGLILCALVIAINYSPQMQALAAMPDTLRLIDGQTHVLSLGLPFKVNVQQEDAAVLGSQAQTLSQATQTSVSLSPAKAGEAQLELSLLGILPIKKVDVRVSEQRVVIPGGNVIGVALQTKGVLVVGTSDLSGDTQANPAVRAGIRPGDLILTVGGTQVESGKHLSELINNCGNHSVEVGLRRQNRNLSLSVTPAMDRLDGRYRLGVWVRDNTAGVGTLSFYDPNTKQFGALGHAITDIDTGEFLTVKEGHVLHANVVDVVRGEKGQPGELKGSFLKDKLIFGDITANNQFGIYGACKEAVANPLYPNGLPVGSQSMVHEGPATILSTVDGQGIKAYAVEITRVTPQNKPSQKGMVVKVTDPQLLAVTGGIVQGMSGSPIIQDGRLIGAVTHVFVNDPTQGYGMFIEWMLDQADQAA